MEEKERDTGYIIIMRTEICVAYLLKSLSEVCVLLYIQTSDGIK